MTETEARNWLDQVAGRAFQNRRQPEGPNAWIAVVRTPRHSGRPGKLILAFGKDLVQAAGMAEQEWHEQWQRLGPSH